MIKVIAFDYAGVIAESPMTKWGRTHDDLDPEKLVDYRKTADDWDRGKMTTDQFYNYLGEFTSIPPNRVWQDIFAQTEINPDVVNLIKKLKKNYLIFIFSNFVSETLTGLLQKEDILYLFDEVIASSDYGLMKPEIEFFEILLNKSGANKNEILFIDDRAENVNGGKKFGIKSFLFTNTYTLIKDLKQSGVKI